MRIVQVLGTSAGGTGRHVAGLAAGLVEAGHEVVVAAPPGELKRFGVAHSGARPVPLAVSTRPSRADAQAVRVLGAVTAQADIVHAHGARVGALAAVALRRSTVPLITTLHNATPEGAASRVIHAGLERIVARRSTIVLGVSRDLVARQRALGARDVALAVVAAPDFGEVRHDRDHMRRTFGLADHVALVVSVGRLAAQKDLTGLIDATLLAATDGVALLTVVAGDGPLRPQLQAHIDATGAPVRLLGQRSDIADLLSAADVVASSALWEGQPVWLQEALHVGAAIVATDAGGTADVVGQAAVLVPVSDPRSLAAALADVIRHGTLRDDLRSQATERSAELPTTRDATAAALETYRRALVDGSSATGRR